MEKSEILFILRNYYHEFNQGELNFIFENATSFEKNKDYEHNCYELYLGDFRKILFYHDSDLFEWMAKVSNLHLHAKVKNIQEKYPGWIYHNDLGYVTNRPKHYRLLGGLNARWDPITQRVVEL